MLKLEKVAKSLEVSISLRAQKPFFSLHLIIAFAIALGFHLAAILLFTIRHSDGTQHLSIFPAVYVESIVSSNNHVSIDLNSEDINFRYMHEPPELKPIYPILAGFTVNELPRTINRQESEMPFIKVEQWLTAPSMPLLQRDKKKAKVLDIQIFGGLESYSLFNEGWGKNELALLAKLPFNECKASYEIRLDLQSGSIFWYQPIFDCKSKKFCHLAEQILNRLIFNVPEPSKAIASGLIEISYKRDENYD